MPHIAVKLWPGRSEEEKRAFARAVADDAARYLHADKAWVSVSIEEIDPEAWGEGAYKAVGVKTDQVVFGGGNIHCITQQQPKARCK